MDSGTRPSTDPEPTIINGRYRIIHPLGHGGMGSVFLASDLALEGRPVAVKQIQLGGGSQEGIAAFRAEFEAMTRLRHPNVVEVYDFGQDQTTGEHFLTLEPIEGSDLQSAIADLPREKVFDLLVQVCRGLHYIHARGLIHNDLKPQNIMVTAASPSTCKLMDLGLAFSRKESAPGEPPHPRLRGTVQYLAPELIQGALPDRRSDLYSLGVVFYRALTGRLPFEGDPGEVMRRAVFETPAPPRKWAPDLPETLESLILRLLAKDPSERPSGAASVIEELAAATGTAYSVDTPATRASYIRSGAFVGRQRELDRLTALLDASHSGPGRPGPGRLVLLSGESGIGKSRLIRQLRYEAQLRGGSFAIGQCYEGSGSAFHPFVQILTQLLPEAREETSLGPFFSQEQPLPEAQDPDRRQRLAIDAAAQAILAAASRPLLICLEDLQWIDTASLALLEHLARNAAPPKDPSNGADAPLGAGLVLVATYRSEDAAAPPLAAALPRLMRGAEWGRIELTRFGEKDVAAMLEGMYGLSQVPEDLVEMIMRETEGNPFFVQMAAEALSEEQALARPGIDWVTDIEALPEISFPTSVADAISRRLSRLNPSELRVLEALAVGQAPVEEQVLVSILAEEDQPAATRGAIEALSRARIAAREMGPSGQVKARIDHVRIRDQVYESMDWGRRRDLHGRFGLALEGSADVEEVAHHFINSPDAARALSYAERAGRRAMGLCAGDRAVRFLEAALELVPPSDAPRRLGLQLELGDAYRQARDHPRAIETYERLIKGARAAGVKQIAWIATCHMLDVQTRSGQHEAARRAAEKHVPVLRSEGEKQHLAFCLTVLSTGSAIQGDLEQARELSEQALALRREIGDLPGVASCLNNLGTIDLLVNPTDQGRALLEEALAIRQELSDPQRAAEVLGNLGNWYRKRGDLAAAAERIEKAAEFAREHKDRWLNAQHQTSLAGVYRAQGRYDRALASARGAVASARAMGDAALECEGLDHQGMAERDLGRLAEAAAAHERAASVARRAGIANQEAYALTSLVLDRLSDDPKSLKEILRKASKLVAGLRSPRIQARLHEAFARVCLAAGEIRQAIQHARSAVETSTTGSLPDSQASVELLLSECLLAQAPSELTESGSGATPAKGKRPAHGPEHEEAAEAARRALALAQANGLAEMSWQGHALLAEIERASGRRASEREELGRASQILEAIAAGIEDESVRVAYTLEPRRADLMRRAQAIAPRRAGATAARHAASPEHTLSAIYEITRIINSMSDLDTLLEQVLEVGLGIVGAERGLITLLDEATGDQQVVAARDLEEETVRDALEYSRSVVKEAAAGRLIVALDAGSDERLRGFKSVNMYAIKSLMCVPMKIRDKIIGTVYVDSRQKGTLFEQQDLRFLEAFANLAAGAVEQGRLHARLASENVYLRREAGERHRYQNLIGKTPKMQAVYDLMEKVAASDLTVLIQGESGTGKELVARALHYSGPRRQRKFFSENVAAIPDTLLESEMFGHVRGAFTGADRDRQGLFELADGGTLFLDEVGDMSLPMQSKLLRAIQEGEIRPVGGKETRRVNVRVISATNKDLERMMSEGRFREDLYYRLNVVRIPLPPLRERKEDIPLLVDHFLKKTASDSGKEPKKIELGALQLLLRYSWPGNVRELQNEIQRLAVLCPGNVITQRDLMESGELFEKITRLEEKDSFAPLEELERRQIEKALKEAAGNRGRAAELLGISRATIFRKLRKFGIAH